MTVFAFDGGFRDDGSYALPVRVYYEDTDAGGLVYYANYLKFAERARTEMMRLFGHSHRDFLAEHGVAFAVRRCNVDYIRPARLDDMVTVVSRLTQAAGARLGMTQTIEHAGAVLVTLDLTLACIAVGGGRPSRIPPVLLDRLTAFLATGRPPTL
jgi:acyl-CoA thioester hydrolase